MDTTNLRCPECNSKVRKLSYEEWVICCAMGHWAGPASECKAAEKVYLKDGSDKTGLIWEWDKLRKLGWAEYEYWTTHVLPMGWNIIQVPDKGAEPSA